MNQLNQAPSSREHAREDHDQENQWEQLATAVAALVNSVHSSLQEIKVSAGSADIQARILWITPHSLWTKDRTSNSIQVTLELRMELNARNTTAPATTH